MSQGREKQSFFDLQYYDNGHKLIRYPDVSGLTKYNSQIGLSSLDVELRDGDYAYEFIQCRTDEANIYRLGCYTHLSDLKLGDRGNYCGLGITLVDHVPIDILSLFLGLKEVTDAFCETKKFSPSQEQGLISGAKDILLGELASPISNIPLELWPKKFADGRLRTYYSTVDFSNENALLFIADHVLISIFSSRQFEGRGISNEKIIYVPQSCLKQGNGNSSILSEKETLRDVHRIPMNLLRSGAMATDIRNNLIEEKKIIVEEIETLKTELSQKDDELVKLNQKLSEKELFFDKLNKALPKLSEVDWSASRALNKNEFFDRQHVTNATVDKVLNQIQTAGIKLSSETQRLHQLIDHILFEAEEMPRNRVNIIRYMIWFSSFLVVVIVVMIFTLAVGLWTDGGTRSIPAVGGAMEGGLEENRPLIETGGTDRPSAPPAKNE